MYQYLKIRGGRLWDCLRVVALVNSFVLLPGFSRMIDGSIRQTVNHLCCCWAVRRKAGLSAACRASPARLLVNTNVAEKDKGKTISLLMYKFLFLLLLYF